MDPGNARVRLMPLVAGCALIVASLDASAADWPMFGRDATRNAVSPERGAPIDWDIPSGRNVKWSAPLGSLTFGDPVVSGGLVWVGTNNSPLGSSRDIPDAAVLACFRERDGQLLYRYVSPRLPQGMVHDWPYSSLACSPLIEGERMWMTTNRAEVVCLDIGSLLRSINTDKREPDDEPRIIWKRDLIGELGVFPRGSMMALAHLCSPAGYKGWIYVVTGNGTDSNMVDVPQPDAPSLVCFDKATGKVVWTDNSPGANLLCGQWASPLVVEVDGTPQVIVPQGDGWIRAFQAETGRLIWKFDINRKDAKWSFSGSGTRNNILAAPVFHNGRILIASGQHPVHVEGDGRLVCLDPTKSGDISSELAVDADGQPLPHRRLQAVDATQGERAIPNPNSGLDWEFTKLGDDFEDQFHRSISNVAVQNGLVIAADFSGLVHCLDARTGQRHWVYDTFAQIYAPPLIVDGKVYVADDDGEVAVFRLSADPDVAMQNGGPIAEVLADDSVLCSPIFANGTLYVATQRHLHAIAANTAEDAATRRPGGHWPQWRGPNRDNVSTETGLLKEWPESGPPLLWRAEGLGEGIASVSIVDGRVFTLGYRDQQEYVTALSEETGQQLWMVAIGPAIAENSLMRWLGQRTPTVDDGRLYAVRSNGDLVCLQGEDGQELWRKRYTEDFGTKPQFWGICDYPLVDGDKLICTPAGSEATIVALNRKSGDVIWKVRLGENERSGYVAALVSEEGGLRQYVTLLRNGLVSVAADDGRLLWRYDKFPARAAHSVSPIVHGDSILCYTGYGAGRALLRLLPDGAGVKVQEEYFLQGKVDPFQDSTIWIGDNVHTFRMRGILERYVARTGELAVPAKHRWRGSASMTSPNSPLPSAR